VILVRLFARRKENQASSQGRQIHGRDYGPTMAHLDVSEENMASERCPKCMP
jgi:hypothetical protein